MKCVMCINEASYIDKKTNEALCEKCASINESIYRDKREVGKYIKVGEKKWNKTKNSDTS